MPERAAVTLAAIPILSGLSEADREDILAQSRLRHVLRGEALVRKGELADRLYYVLRGKFEVRREDGELLAEIAAGEPVGEIAFFAGIGRTADVIAARDSDVLEIDRPTWDALDARLPALHAEVLKVLGRRLAVASVSASGVKLRKPKVIGLAQAGRTPLPEALIFALRDALPELEMLRRTDLPAGFDTARPGAISAWLGARESAGEGLLLLSDGSDPAWDQAALRQCDHVLFCGAQADAQSPGDGPVALSEAEIFAAPLFRSRQSSLLLWRRQSAEPISGTARWSSGRALHLTHHIALDQPADFARLARFVTGRALGAVFGGGGAFGAAHIGALRALYAAGLRFDIAGGTSIGSTVAIAIAAGHEPDRMLADFEWSLARQRALGRIAVPRYGLFDSHHTDAVLRQLFGEGRLEDLPLNAFAAAANITTHNLWVLREGLIWRAVRASTSIPGALPPYITEGGEVIVDGGIMDNVPLSVMRGLKSGPNMIFSLSASTEWRVRTPYAAIPSRGRMFWQTLTRRKDRTDLPRIAEVVGRSMQIASERSFKGTSLGNDLMLELPGLPGMGLLSFRLARRQEALGYEFTMRRLEALGGPEALLAWSQTADESS